MHHVKAVVARSKRAPVSVETAGHTGHGPDITIAAERADLL